MALNTFNYMHLDKITIIKFAKIQLRTNDPTPLEVSRQRNCL